MAGSLFVVANMATACRPFLHSTDPAEVGALQAMATVAIKRQREYEAARDRNLAAAVGNQVGRVVSQALERLAQAMSG